MAVFCWRGGDRELFCWVRAVKFFCFELGLHIRFIVGVALSEALGEKFAQPLIVLFHVELNFLFFFSRRTCAGYGGHDGRLTDVVRPSVPSADAFESSSVREKLSARDVTNLN